MIDITTNLKKEDLTLIATSECDILYPATLKIYKHKDFPNDLIFYGLLNEKYFILNEESNRITDIFTIDEILGFKMISNIKDIINMDYKKTKNHTGLTNYDCVNAVKMYFLYIARLLYNIKPVNEYDVVTSSILLKKEHDYLEFILDEYRYVLIKIDNMFKDDSLEKFFEHHKKQIEDIWDDLDKRFS